MLTEFISGFSAVLSDPSAIFWCLIGVTLGTLLGALPGLGAVTGIAMLLPLTFQLNELNALVLLMSVYMGAQFGGRISSILINIPGDATAIVSTFDGYPLTRQGRAGFALTLSAIASFFGGLIGILGLIFLTSQLGKVALMFGPPDYFGLMLFTLVATCGITEKRPLKPIIAMLLGLLISSIGNDIVTGQERLTFGIVQLWDGIHIVAIAIGLFGLSETLFSLERSNKVNHDDSSSGKLKFSSLFPKASELIKYYAAMIRGSIIGFIIGVLPGAGGVLATFLSYGFEKKISKHPEKFGKGAPEGLTTAEAANNASVGGALIPTFALGIPGSGAAAVLLGGLLIIGLQPGPMMMVNSGDIVWASFAGLFLANILLLILNTAFVPFFAILIKKAEPYMVAIIASLCIIGVYFTENNLFNVGILLFFGVLGYLLRKTGYPLAPLFLGVILGPMLEKNLRQSLLMSQGDYSIFFVNPISCTLIIITIGVLLLPFIRLIKKA